MRLNTEIPRIGADEPRIPHYHLRVRLPMGQTIELRELFRDDNEQSGETAATIKDVRELVEDKLDNAYEVEISWKGQKFGDEVKIKDIIVDGVSLPLYVLNVDMLYALKKSNFV